MSKLRNSLLGGRPPQWRTGGSPRCWRTAWPPRAQSSACRGWSPTGAWSWTQRAGGTELGEPCSYFQLFVNSALHNQLWTFTRSYMLTSIYFETFLNCVDCIFGILHFCWYFCKYLINEFKTECFEAKRIFWPPSMWQKVKCIIKLKYNMVTVSCFKTNILFALNVEQFQLFNSSLIKCVNKCRL